MLLIGSVYIDQNFDFLWDDKNIAKVLFVEESEPGQKIRKYVVKKTCAWSY